MADQDMMYDTQWLLRKSEYSTKSHVLPRIMCKVLKRNIIKFLQLLSTTVLKT